MAARPQTRATAAAVFIAGALVLVMRAEFKVRFCDQSILRPAKGQAARRVSIESECGRRVAQNSNFMAAPRREASLKRQGAPTGTSRSCSTRISYRARIANRPRVFIARPSTVAAEMHSFPLIREKKFAFECVFSSRSAEVVAVFVCEFEYIHVFHPS